MTPTVPAAPIAPFDPARGRWIPWVFAGLMLLVVLVNGVLITAAVTTFAGTTGNHAYDRGRAYNQVLEEAARQAALGWQAELALVAGRLTVSVRDAAGAPVPGRLSGEMLRPLQGTTRALEFSPAGAGDWTAAAEALAPGQWEARLTLAAPDRGHLDIRRRVIAP